MDGTSALFANSETQYSLATRKLILRALGFGATGSAIIVVANIFVTVVNLAPGKLPSSRFRFFQLLAFLGVAAALCAGAFAGFATVRARNVSSAVALALGLLAEVPVFLVASTLLLRTGPAGAIMVAIWMPALIAAVGGGALRWEASHGQLRVRTVELAAYASGSAARRSTQTLGRHGRRGHGAG